MTSGQRRGKPMGTQVAQSQARTLNRKSRAGFHTSFRANFTTNFSALAREPATVAVNLIVLIVLAIAAIFVAAPRPRAAAAASPVQATPGEMRSGALLLRDGDRFIEAPRLGTDIDLTVSGPTARARVTQVFNNPTDHWIEAVYVYPLPDGGAVDTL